MVDMPGSKFTTQMELNLATPRAPYRIWVRPISEGGMFGVSRYFLLYRLSHSVSQTRNVGSKVSFLPMLLLNTLYGSERSQRI